MAENTFATEVHKKMSSYQFKSWLVCDAYIHFISEDQIAIQIEMITRVLFIKSTENSIIMTYFNVSYHCDWMIRMK